MNSEFVNNKEILDQNTEKEKMEIELKLTPVDLNFFDFFKQIYEGKYIHQIYPSEASKDYSVRLRSTAENGLTTYSAALKETGEVVRGGLARKEVPTQISQEAFERYAADSRYASLKKLRIEPADGVSIDFIEGWPHPIIEIEDIEISEEAQQFLELYQDQLIDHSGEVEVNNEYIAYALSGMKYEKEVSKELSAQKVVDEIMAYRSIGLKNVVVTVSGRSGSGKTTLAKEVQTLLAYTKQLPSVLLSTDNYHVGKNFLETNYQKPWVNWDSPLVGNTVLLNEDVKKILSGETVPRRLFSFKTQEPYIDGEVTPHNIVIIEGVQAGSNDLIDVRTFHRELPTPFAESLGRDTSRFGDGSRQNSSIGTKQNRVRYQIEVAEPAYQSKDMPRREVWPANVSSMGSIALKKES